MTASTCRISSAIGAAAVGAGTGARAAAAGHDRGASSGDYRKRGLAARERGPPRVGASGRTGESPGGVV